MSSQTTDAIQKRKPLKGIQVGVVVSDSRDKTRKVVVNFLAKDSKYGKYVRQRSQMHIHDPENESHNGDTVEIVPCRPMSKTKTWRLVRIIDKAPGAIA